MLNCRHIIFLLLASVLIFTGCSDSDNGETKDIDDYVGNLFVSLEIDRQSSTPATRSNPTGGEEGDGWRYAAEQENRLHDFTVFVITNSDVNDGDNVPIIGSKYFSSGDVAAATMANETVNGKDVVSYDFTITVRYAKGEDIISPDKLRFIVVANAGDLSKKFALLGQVRDYIPEQTWTPYSSFDKYSRFVMSNENDGQYITGTGSQFDPVRLHVSIERMAARVDFCKDGATISGNEYKYPIYNEDLTTPNGSSFYLSHVKIVNGMTKPSYLLKRVANTVGGDVTYLGDETATTAGVPTNYVIEPTTSLKTASNQTNTALLTSWFGSSTLAESMQLTYMTDADRVHTGSGNAFTNGTSYDDKDRLNYYVVGYVNENTMDKDISEKEFVTGLELKGTFVPATVYSGYEASTNTLTKSTTYTKGTTFYRYVRALGDDDEQEALYFDNIATANAFMAAHPEDFGTIVEYTGGVCYYYVWLRHGNNAPEQGTGIMEYGIVRNNIYRVAIDNITKIGEEKPEPDGPEYVRLKIFVRKWNYYETSIIYL